MWPLLREPRISRIGSFYGDGTAVHSVRLTDVPDLGTKMEPFSSLPATRPWYTDTRQTGVGVLGTLTPASGDGGAGDSIDHFHRFYD